MERYFVWKRGNRVKGIRKTCNSCEREEKRGGRIPVKDKERGKRRIEFRLYKSIYYEGKINGFYNEGKFSDDSHNSLEVRSRYFKERRRSWGKYEGGGPEGKGLDEKWGGWDSEGKIIELGRKEDSEGNRWRERRWVSVRGKEVKTEA